MVHITLNVTCYLLLFTSRFRCVYAGISLKYFVVNNAKQVPRNVNTTTPMTQAYQVYDLRVLSL